MSLPWKLQNPLTTLRGNRLSPGTVYAFCSEFKDRLNSTLKRTFVLEILCGLRVPSFDPPEEQPKLFISQRHLGVHHCCKPTVPDLHFSFVQQNFSAKAFTRNTSFPSLRLRRVKESLEVLEERSLRWLSRDKSNCRSRTKGFILRDHFKIK